MIDFVSIIIIPIMVNLTCTERSTVCLQEFEAFYYCVFFFAKSCQKTVSPCLAPTGQMNDLTINDAYNVLEAVTQSVDARAAGIGTTESTVRT